MTRLQELSAALVQHDDLKPLLQKILAAAADLTGTDKGNIQIYHREKRTLSIFVHQGLGSRLVEHFADDGWVATCSEAADKMRRVIIEDVEKLDHLRDSIGLEVVLEDGIRAIQSTPLFNREGQLLGMLNNHYRTPGSPTDSELRIIDLLARQAADLIERAHAEEALHEREHALRCSEERFRTIVERSPFGMYVVDSQFRIAHMNQSGQEGTFTNVRPVIGRPFDEAMRILWPEHIAARVIDIFRHTLETGEPYYSRDFIAQRIDVEKTEGYEWELHRIALPDGQHGLICYYFDSTVLRAAQHREHELRAAAEEVNRLKDDFLAIMSHELRNPLNVILGYSELLVRSEELAQYPQLQRMAETIRRNAKAQSKLIRDLLDLSRLRSGKLQLNRETVAMEVAVANAIDTVKPDAEPKQIGIQFIQPEESLLVDGDPVRLEQIVWNLLNNAVKFSDDGSKITVRLAKEREEVVLTVEDQGQGVDPAFLPGMFELFRQADSSPSHTHTGMGIGLAVVQQLVELHNGKVTADSAGINQGAVFKVTLPATVEKSEPAPVSTTKTRLDQLTVLVVDDSEDTAEMLTQVLRMSGAVVTSATSGNEALQIAAKMNFDVVLSDISMPGMDGFEFLQRLRALPDQQDVPVLALTGFGRPQDIDRAMKAGFFSHITKPFDLHALALLLGKLPKRSDRK